MIAIKLLNIQKSRIKVHAIRFELLQSFRLVTGAHDAQLLESATDAADAPRETRPSARHRHTNARNQATAAA